MTKLIADYSKTLGKIKPMHGIGQPPIYGLPGKYFHYLTEANVPFSRLHDVGGAYGGFRYVDIPNLFRDFNADENDPANYDFTFTDLLIQELMNVSCKPIFRLGVTIENYFQVRAYRIDPPADFAKWARICEHVIRHYNEGWADGFHFGIEYWEIWNEPDNEPGVCAMWTGTDQQYFELYETTAKHLKACFGDSIKIGAYGACGVYHARDFETLDWCKNDGTRYRYQFAEAFLDYIVKTGSPLDFFSWHSYSDIPDTIRMAKNMTETLEAHGLTNVETQLNEWNNGVCWNNPHAVEDRGTSFASAQCAGMMLAMQDLSPDICCFYDGRIGESVYGGLFNPITYQPFCTYYSLKAFGELYTLGTQAACTVHGDDLFAVAAKDGDKLALMIANIGEDTTIESNLPAEMKAYQVDIDHALTEVEKNPLRFNLPKNTVLLFKNY